MLKAVKTLSLAAATGIYLSSAVAGPTSGPIGIVSQPEQSDAIEAPINSRLIASESFAVSENQVRVIVQLEDAPMAQFEGVNPAMSKFTSAKGLRVDFASKAAVEYKTFLTQKQNTMIASAKSIDPTLIADFKYQAAFNGFAAVVNKDRIDQIAAMPGVKAVYPDSIMHATDDASLDLINAPAVWNMLGGDAEAGRGVRVAIIDSGIRPENPLFDDAGFTAPDPATLPDDDYCSEQPDFCNNKLIVARNSPVATGFTVVPEEYDSPLGYNGHGTHVAGTAVGNFGVTATRGDATATIGGVAPGAYLMVYKGLYTTPANTFSGSGTNSMLLDSLESALLDGADIVNNSWGGGAGGSPAGSPYLDVFRAMQDAGVVTVFSAGNSGPGARTIGCPGCSEEVLTVAASTTGRLFANPLNVVGEDGLQDVPALFSGAAPIPADFSAPVIYSGAIEPANFEGCNAFAAADAFADSIALIARGSCGFAAKIANAEAAGAVGVVIFNVASRGESPILMGGLSPTQAIPSVMIGTTPGSALVDVIANAETDVVVEIGDTLQRTFSPAIEDVMASFSSRGPNGDPNFMKPEISAPGVRIFSGESPEAPGNIGENFSFKNGTSMSAPHVAGAAALIRQMHPEWTSQQVKSALVASSVRDNMRKEDEITPADNFDMGAGRLDVARASAVTVTFNELTLTDASCFLDCSFVIEATNTGDQVADLSSASFFGGTGVVVDVQPASAELQPGETAQVTINADVRQAGTDWALGGIRWTDANNAGTEYYVPIAILPLNTDNPTVFRTTADAASVGGTDAVTFTAEVRNQDIIGDVTLSGTLDGKFQVDPQSISATLNGAPETVSYDPSARSISWTGELSPAALSLQADTSIGDLLSGFNLPRFLPMAAIGVTPAGCSSICDDTTIDITLPQPITYLGTSYSTMTVSSNGFISLGSDSDAVFSADPSTLPDANEPNNVIAPFWADLDLDGTAPDDTGAGNIYLASLTTGHFVVEWAGAEIFDAPGVTYNFQIWLEYATGQINFVYGPMGVPTIAEAPLGVVVGAENSSGQVGTTFAEVSDAGTTGTLPVAGDELVVDTAAGDELIVSYSGLLNDRNEYSSDSIVVDEDSSITFNLVANDNDSVIINNFTLQSDSVSLRSYAPVTTDVTELDVSTLAVTAEPSNGTVAVTPMGMATYTPNADYFGDEQFSYSIRDVNGDLAVAATVDIAVANINDAPTLSVSAPTTVRSGETFTIQANEADVDGEPVFVFIRGEGVESGSSSVTVTAPDTTKALTLTYVVSVSDGQVVTSQDVNIEVTPRKEGGSLGWAVLLLALLGVRRQKTIR